MFFSTLKGRAKRFAKKSIIAAVIIIQLLGSAKSSLAAWSHHSKECIKQANIACEKWQRYEKEVKKGDAGARIDVVKYEMETLIYLEKLYFSLMKDAKSSIKDKKYDDAIKELEASKRYAEIVLKVTKGDNKWERNTNFNLEQINKLIKNIQK